MDDASDVMFRVLHPAWVDKLGSGGLLFLGATDHPGLAELSVARATLCQPFRPWAQGLDAAVEGRAGWEVHASDEALGDGYDVVLIRPERQREAAEARIGRGVLAARPGGTVVISAPSREGGKRLVGLLESVGAEVVEASKHRCRAVAFERTAAIDEDQLRVWAASDAPRPILDGAFLSRPGVFSWDHIDTGTEVLRDALPTNLGRVVVDAGAGWGVLGQHVVQHADEVLERVHLLEADGRALALCRTNVKPTPQVAVQLDWLDATEAWPMRGVDTVVMNPPFHEGGRSDPNIGRAFVTNGHHALRRGGALWLVANRHLAYERTMGDLFGRFRVVVETRGFKVLMARKPT